MMGLRPPSYIKINAAAVQDFLEKIFSTAFGFPPKGLSRGGLKLLKLLFADFQGFECELPFLYVSSG